VHRQGGEELEVVVPKVIIMIASLPLVRQTELGDTDK
jgi:hypothetical protein